METNIAEIKIRGKAVAVPSINISGKTVIAIGKWIRMAEVHDEIWYDGQVADPPELFMTKIKKSKLKADIFTFAQKIPHIKPKYNFYMEWDNVAAIPITRFNDWWDFVSTDMRKDVKRAATRGVTVKVVDFNDELVQGIIDIHNDTPMRQGGLFYHFGKDFDTVKSDYSSFIDRSDFVGAYYENELIGLIKIVYVGELACFMQILSKTTHNDKRPTNALIAKAVELCVEKNKTYLTYGKYYYGNKQISSLVDFKHRNGFERILFPRYYIPLTLKGRIYVLLKLHRGLLGILPGSLIPFLIQVRSKVNQILLSYSGSKKNYSPQP